MYSFRGLLEICRYSNQPKADAVMDFLYDLADEIRRTGSYRVKCMYRDKALPDGVMDGARLIFEVAGIKGNQAALALDKVYRSYTGKSALQAGEITLTAPSNEQILTPTEIGEHYGLKAHRVNEILAGAGYQHKIAGRWEPLGDGEQYAVMLDVGKRHKHKGTPVRQLKWTSSILPVFESLMRH